MRKTKPQIKGHSGRAQTSNLPTNSKYSSVYTLYKLILHKMNKLYSNDKMLGPPSMSVIRRTLLLERKIIGSYVINFPFVNAHMVW